MEHQEEGEGVSLEDKLLALRRLVIGSGLPNTDFYCLSADRNTSTSTGTGMGGRRVRVPSEAAPSLRTCVWKVLLGALVVDGAAYLALMKVLPWTEGGGGQVLETEWGALLSVPSYVALLSLPFSLPHCDMLQYGIWVYIYDAGVTCLCVYLCCLKISSDRAQQTRKSVMTPSAHTRTTR